MVEQQADDGHDPIDFRQKGLGEKCNPHTRSAVAVPRVLEHRFRRTVAQRLYAEICGLPLNSVDSQQVKAESDTRCHVFLLARPFLFFVH
jgi:hypothetical protein